jgi:hypothetical protein
MTEEQQQAVKVSDRCLNMTFDYLIKPIYRILPLERFLTLLRTKTDSLTKISKVWEDPYENYLFKCLFTDSFRGDGAAAEFGYSYFHEKVFGQCWSFKKESDAMWRIYSNKKYCLDKNLYTGIKVKSTPSILLNNIMNNNASLRDSLFCGRIKYQTRQQIEEHFSSFGDAIAMGHLGKATNLLEEVLYKREEFSHEDEMRILHIDRTSFKDDYLPFNIEPNEIFLEVELDPRLSSDEVKIITEALLDNSYRNAVNKSNLYEVNIVASKVR